jgi:hypothetical protein
MMGQKRLIMIFIFRTLFWLSLVIFILPDLPPSQADKASVQGTLTQADKELAWYGDNNERFAQSF